MSASDTGASPQTAVFRIHRSRAFPTLIRPEKLNVIIRFSREQAPYVLERQWHSSQSLKENKDDTVDLSFTASSLYEVKRWVLSCGADAQVLGPPELIKDLKDEINKMKVMYSPRL